MAEKTPRQFPEESSISANIGFLFSGYSKKEPSDELSTISKYFEYLGSRIDYDSLQIDVSSELLGHFEALCLLLSDRIRLYPDAIQEQVAEVLQKEDLARVFAVFAAISEDHKRRLARKYRSKWSALMRYVFANSIVAPLEMSPERLFTLKLALNRLAQIVRYASTIQFIDYDTGADRLNDHYDPSLIEKAKLLALVNALKVQLGKVPDESVRERLLERVNQLEDEIRKSRPRWGRIIAGFFIVFSFVADVKSVTPDAYDAVYDTITAIMRTMHEEGSVQYHRHLPLLPPPTETRAILPDAAKLKGAEEENEDDDAEE